MKIDNAVILAAGFSSRFVPVCFDVPKGLLSVFGETLIERQIRQLKGVGIYDITIVTGAYADQFEFLKEKHAVKIVFNPDYANKNNFASLYAARSVLHNTIISSCDLYFTHNIFQNETEHSYYASVFIKGRTNQRSLTLDKNDKIIGVQYGGANKWITFGGQAVFTAEVSKALIDKISKVYDDPDYANWYWVDFQDKYLSEIPMYIKRINNGYIKEFNTLEALQNFDEHFSATKYSRVMKYLCQQLGVGNERDLSSFQPLKKDNILAGCSFEFNRKRYTYWHQNNKIGYMSK